MIRKKLRTRKPKAVVKRTIRDLGQQLTGRKRTQLTNLFKANLAAEIFREETKSFLARSAGGSDEFGNQWQPLAQSTIDRKLKKSRLRNRKLDKFRENFASGLMREGLSARDARINAGIAARMRRGGDKRVPIGIDTQELLNSLRPGSVSRGRYYRVKNQVAKLEEEGGIAVGTNVEHAEHFNGRRKIFPKNEQVAVWVKRATEKAIDKVVDELLL